mmetsp:Transcript_64971/g.180168  ORF Transcript_64971/g.180168 Transcript_64971/m.180168 type:complete len:559 (+) Transcript_64971:1316-2992(+)
MGDHVENYVEQVPQALLVCGHLRLVGEVHRRARALCLSERGRAVARLEPRKAPGPTLDERPGARAELDCRVQLIWRERPQRAVCELAAVRVPDGKGDLPLAAHLARHGDVDRAARRDAGGVALRQLASARRAGEARLASQTVQAHGVGRGTEQVLALGGLHRLCGRGRSPAGLGQEADDDLGTLHAEDLHAEAVLLLRLGRGEEAQGPPGDVQAVRAPAVGGLVLEPLVAGVHDVGHVVLARRRAGYLPEVFEELAARARVVLQHVPATQALPSGRLQKGLRVPLLQVVLEVTRPCLEGLKSLLHGFDAIRVRHPRFTERDLREVWHACQDGLKVNILEEPVIEHALQDGLAALCLQDAEGLPEVSHAERIWWVDLQPPVQIVHCHAVHDECQQDNAGDMERHSGGDPVIHEGLVLHHEAHREAHCTSQTTPDEHCALLPRDAVPQAREHGREDGDDQRAHRVQAEIEQQQLQPRCRGVVQGNALVVCPHETGADDARAEEDHVIAHVADLGQHYVVCVPPFVRQQRVHARGDQDAKRNGRQDARHMQQFRQEEGAVH